MSVSAGRGAKKARSGASSLTWIVRIALLAVMVLLVVVFVKDRSSRRACDAAFAKLEEFVVDARSSGSIAPKNNKEVRQAVGINPEDDLVDKGSYYEEIYRWARLVPGRAYYIHVIYIKGSEPLLHAVAKNGPPEESELP